jgi:pimeloyl-ACP methyl ester carboxylesterase
MLLRNAVVAALSIAATALTIVGQAAAAPAQASLEQIAPYVKPQQVVNVGTERTINLVCLGHGYPTVILSAGLGNWSFAWMLVQRQLSKRTRVCAWDRAGYGFSSPSPEPQDIVHTTQDLEQALKKADIRGPYVMVGHSLGAYETLRFTDLHRESIVGMVLVDPTIPDQQALTERIAPLFHTKARALDSQTVKQLQDCAAELTSGALKRSTPQFDQCTAVSGVPLDYQSVRAALAQLNTNPARLLTQASTIREFDSDIAHDAREAINAQRSYGDMPLTVLTAGRDESSLDTLVGAATPDEVAVFHKQVAQFIKEAWSPAHDAYAALSTRGHRLIPDAGHGIQYEKPDVVISAIAEVLDNIPPSKPLQP